MLLNCDVGEESWESLGLQGDPTSPFWRKSVLNIHWKDWCWCWSWNSNTLATWWELTHFKRPRCWERLRAGGDGDDRGWDGWMASSTEWTWVCVSSRSWWWTGRPGVPRFMGSGRRVRHDWATGLDWTELIHCFLWRKLPHPFSLHGKQTKPKLLWPLKIQLKCQHATSVCFAYTLAEVADSERRDEETWVLSQPLTSWSDCAPGTSQILSASLPFCFPFKIRMGIGASTSLFPGGAGPRGEPFSKMQITLQISFWCHRFCHSLDFFFPIEIEVQQSTSVAFKKESKPLLNPLLCTAPFSPAHSPSAALASFSPCYSEPWLRGLHQPGCVTSHS